MIYTRASAWGEGPEYISPVRQQHLFITLNGEAVANVVTADSIQGYVEVLDMTEEGRLRAAALSPGRVATVVHHGIVLIYCHKPRWMA